MTGRQAVVCERREVRTIYVIDLNDYAIVNEVPAVNASRRTCQRAYSTVQVAALPGAAHASRSTSSRWTRRTFGGPSKEVSAGVRALTRPLGVCHAEHGTRPHMGCKLLVAEVGTAVLLLTGCPGDDSRDDDFRARQLTRWRDLGARSASGSGSTGIGSGRARAGVRGQPYPARGPHRERALPRAPRQGPARRRVPAPARELYLARLAPVRAPAPARRPMRALTRAVPWKIATPLRAATSCSKESHTRIYHLRRTWARGDPLLRGGVHREWQWSAPETASPPSSGRPARPRSHRRSRRSRPPAAAMAALVEPIA